MAVPPPGTRYKLMRHHGEDLMPRGTIPRQPSKTGRHDKATTSRLASKPLKATPAKARAPKPPKATAYNPLAPERINAILHRLDARYPNVKCALNHNSAWELLVATILSAKCTDARVNMFTPILFEKYPRRRTLPLCSPKNSSPTSAPPASSA